ncbi:putative plant self-incompatibility S1 [Medicago truncatula]|uniref:S-protein homolog n=1 Tax=Medicago truncatula TaxID=3880 RepID=A0A072VKU3_MEDTR|nr:leguminosin group486 secreted peptide [Medicago truncatula]RHN79922.1 putative plant self-incompatibility S1 [Medicago truncatula]
MIPISKFVLLASILLPIFVTLQFNKSESTLPGFTKVTVTVTNNLTDLQVGVDCKDKNYDFGFRTIKFSESYVFKFRPTFIIGRSQYFCGVNWINGDHHFDFYIQKRDQDCGFDCSWVINESGPCKIKKDSKDCFHWNSNVVLREKQRSLTHNVT